MRFITGTGGTLLKTIDGGNNWNEVHTQQKGNWLNAVFFTDINTGYAAGWKGVLLKTNDSGANWAKIVSDKNIFFTAIQFTGGLTGFAAGADLIRDEGVFYFTRDGGESWAKQTFRETTKIFDLHFYDKQTGFILAEEDGKDMIFRSVDGGKNWKGYPTGTKHKLVSIFATGIGTVFAVGEQGKIITITMN